MTDLGHVATPQLVEAAVLGHLQVTRAGAHPGGDPGGEGAHLPRGRITHLYPFAGVVREEVVADVLLREPFRSRFVESASGNHAASGGGGMPVGIDRLRELGILRWSLDHGPAVVGAFRPPVYLLIRLATGASHVVDEDGALAGLDGHLVGVTQAQSPDRPVLAFGPLVERVVGGDGAVLVYPEYLAPKAVQRLGGFLQVVVAVGDIELAVLAELQRSAVVVGRPLVGQPEDEFFAARDGFVTAGGDAHDAVVSRAGSRGLHGVIEVDVVVFGEPGVEGDPHQAALYVRIDLGGEVDKRREIPAGLHYAHEALLVCHEQPSIWRERHVGTTLYVADDLSLLKARREISGALRGLAQRQENRGDQQARAQRDKRQLS